MKPAITITLFLLAMAVQALADGKMFWKEEIPPTIPYQRALILFRDGRETLVLQSKYEIPRTPAKVSLGWVVPVPAVPEVASMPAGSAQSMFWELSMRSRPRVTSLFDMIAYVLFFGLLGLSLMTLLLGLLSYVFPFPPWFLRNRDRLIRFPFYSLLTLILMSPIAFISARAWKGGDYGVDVIAEHRVGIYDVKVVKATDTGELIAWLQAHEFKFGDEDKSGFESYVSKGWCFVVANIRPTAEQTEREIVAEGLVAPLILRFPVKAPIYPVALTATGHHDTEILIYLVCETKMACDNRLKLRFAGERDSTRSLIWLLDTEPAEFFSPEGPEELFAPYLCKFRDTLTSAQMTQDITFSPASDNEPYQEHILKW